MVTLPQRYIESGQVIKGGFSIVRICTDTVLERKVAIKEVSDLAESRRIQDEAAALSRLRSRHVVEIYDVIRDGEHTAIVEDFVEGPDLEQIITARALPDHEQLRFLYQLAKGLSDVHRAGVVHRDIKPQNARLTRNNVLKIFDFGLARTSPDDFSTLGYKGTRGFSAPELFGAGDVCFTQAVDVYALGCTAWFIAQRGIPDFLLDRSRGGTKPIGSIGEVLRGASHSTISLLDRCIAIDPKERPTSEEVASELEVGILQGKHRALLRLGSESHWLDAEHRAIRIKLGDSLAFTISYDGTAFFMQDVTGSIFVNNSFAAGNFRLPDSCVIAMGETSLAWNRRFVTFDASHPEIRY